MRDMSNPSKPAPHRTSRSGDGDACLDGACVMMATIRACPSVVVRVGKSINRVV